MFVYDFPFSPKARTYLKFEAIFKRAEACQFLSSEAETMSLLRGVVDYMDLIDGSGGFKIELSRDLEKLDQKLKQWEVNPDADQAFVHQLRDAITQSFNSLDRFTRQRTVLQHDPILENIKPRFMTPCGVNCFDTPLFTFWCSLPHDEKMQSVNLDAVDKETLVDASGFVFDNSLPLEKRAARMLEQLKNPYCFRYGDMAIKLEFAEDGPSLQELLTGFFLRQKSGL